MPAQNEPANMLTIGVGDGLQKPLEAEDHKAIIDFLREFRSRVA